MATPKSGSSISFSQLNTEILQAGSTTQLSMNSAGVRMGYGATSQVSMSDLMGCFGGTITAGSFPGNKYVAPFEGYDNVFATGSIDNAVYTSGGRITSILEASSSGTTTLYIDNGASGNPPAGYQGTDVNRFALADTSRTLGTGAAGTRDCTYNMPASGSVTFGLRFA